MKRLATMAPISIFLALLLVSSPAGAIYSGDRESVIIVFHDPVTQEDIQYLEAMGGIIKYTYTIINGVAVDLPIIAANKLRIMQQYPSSPLSDPIAKRISYIEDDSMVYALGDDNEVSASGKPSVDIKKPGRAISRQRS
jgi:hypothetical protein